MNDESYRQTGGSEQILAIQDGHNRAQNRSRRQQPRVKILIAEIKRGAGNRHGQQNCHRTDGGPLGVRLVETSSADLPTSPQQEKDRNKVPQQQAESHWQVADANRAGDQLVKYCCLKLQGEELEIMRIKLRIQMPLDSRKIDAVIFHSWMVTMKQDCESSEEKKNPQTLTVVFQFNNPLRWEIGSLLRSRV